MHLLQISTRVYKVIRCHFILYFFLLYNFTHFFIKFVHPLRLGASLYNLHSFLHRCPLSRRPLSRDSNTGPPYSSSTRYCATNWTMLHPLSTELAHASELRRTRVYMYNFYIFTWPCNQAISERYLCSLYTTSYNVKTFESLEDAWNNPSP